MIVDFALLNNFSVLDNLLNFKKIQQLVFPDKILYLAQKNNSLVISLVSKKNEQYFCSLRQGSNNRITDVVFSANCPLALKAYLQKYEKQKLLFGIQSILLEEVLRKYYNYNNEITKIKSVAGKEVYQFATSYLYTYCNDSFYPFLYHFNKFKLADKLLLPLLLKNNLGNFFSINNGQFLFVVEKIFGQSGRYLENQIDKRMITDSADKLYKFHQTDYRVIFPSSRVPKSLIAQELLAVLMQSGHKFQLGLCHFDLNLTNLLYDNKKLKGILDLDNIDYGYIFEDIIYFIYELLNNQMVMQAQEFIVRYKSLNKFLEDDLRVIKEVLWPEINKYEKNNKDRTWLREVQSVSNKDEILKELVKII